MIPIDSIKPNPANPRTIAPERLAKLKNSLRSFIRMLELRPIIVDENYIALGGNMRLAALKELGYTELEPSWIKQVTDLSEAQKKEFIIKDNLDYGEWDWDELANTWDDSLLQEWGMDIPNFTTKEVQDDFIPIGLDQIKTDIKQGDLFQIGQHWLLCGDSTSKADTERLMANLPPPILMVTDPPYGVNYDPTWRHRAGINDSGRQGKVGNDDRVDWSETYKLFPGNIAYIWHAGRHAREVQAQIESAGFDMVSQIIWNKQQMVFGRGDYHWKHEPCWYAVRKGAKHNWQGDRKQTTVWDITSILQSTEAGDEANFHGTQKPVECMARPIRNNTRQGDPVYDPFLGSGTTMVAAEQLQRVCYGIELVPEYCQIVINRMVALVPGIPIKRNGEVYIPLG